MVLTEIWGLVCVWSLSYSDVQISMELFWIHVPIFNRIFKLQSEKYLTNTWLAFLAPGFDSRSELVLPSSLCKCAGVPRVTLHLISSSRTCRQRALPVVHLDPKIQVGIMGSHLPAALLHSCDVIHHPYPLGLTGILFRPMKNWFRCKYVHMCSPRAARCYILSASRTESLVCCLSLGIRRCVCQNIMMC